MNLPVFRTHIARRRVTAVKKVSLRAPYTLYLLLIRLYRRHTVARKELHEPANERFMADGSDLRFKNIQRGIELKSERAARHVGMPRALRITGSILHFSCRRSLRMGGVK